MQGKITRGIGGFYYVHIPNHGIYECKAKGIFRKEGLKPLVGDNVQIKILDQETKKGNVEEILPRKNSLIRPAVANIDQALVIFSVVKPEPNFNLLDRFLISMEKQNIPCTICFNKTDIASSEMLIKLEAIYKNTGYEILTASANECRGIDDLKSYLANKTTTVAGPSGVGKSSLINCLQNNITMKTGTISTKIERGKHTTRHAELIALESGYIVDTPGFSSVVIDVDDEKQLGSYFPEFDEYEEFCKFQGCSHIHEPECGIKNALSEGKISKERYENYIIFYNECKEKRRF